MANAAAAAKSLQSCPTLCNPIDDSPPGSPVPGILQARTLGGGGGGRRPPSGAGPGGSQGGRAPRPPPRLPPPRPSPHPTPPHARSAAGMPGRLLRVQGPGSRKPRGPPGQHPPGRGWRCAGGGAASAGRTAAGTPVAGRAAQVQRALRRISLVAQMVKCLPAMRETQVRSLGREE